MGLSFGDLFNKRDHMNEENFIHNLTRLFSPSFWTAFDSFFNIFEDENWLKKSNSDLWFEIYEMRIGDGVMDTSSAIFKIQNKAVYKSCGI